MQLKPFLLDDWLDRYEHDIEFDIAASTGPTWTVDAILALADEETRRRFTSHKLVYGHPAGADSLRAAIAEMQGVPVEISSGDDGRIGGAAGGDVAGDGALRQCHPAYARVRNFFGAASVPGPGNALLPCAPRERLPHGSG